MALNAEKLIHSVLLCVCLGGFCIVVFDQVKNWYLGKRATIVSYEDEHKVTFPIVVFCPQQAFVNASQYFPFIAKEEYDERAVDLVIIPRDVGKYETDPEKSQLNATEDVLYTVYNGKCKAFTVTNDIYVRDFLSFEIRLRKPFIVFFLRDESDMIFLTILSMQRNIVSLKAESSIVFSLAREEVHLLDYNNQKCHDPEPGELSYNECIIERLQDAFARNMSCASIHFQRFLPDFRDKQCQDTNDITHSVDLAREVITGVMKSRDLCTKSCIKHFYQVQALPMNIPTSRDGQTSEEWVVVMSFLTGVVTKNFEYIVYNTVSIVSAIGGALGMFLGMSVYKDFFEIWHVFRLHKWCPCSKARNTV